MVTLGRTTGGLNTSPAAGTYYSDIYIASEEFQADHFVSPFTGAGDMATGNSAGWQKAPSSGGSWTTQYTIVAGEDYATDHAPKLVRVGERVRFFIVHNGGIANVSTGTSFPFQMRAYISGPAPHAPSVGISSPSGNIGTNLRPSITWSYSDTHPLRSASFEILQGTTVIRSATRSQSSNSVSSGTYTYNFLFGENAADLPRGGNFTYRVTATCDYGYSKTVTKTFTTSSSATSLTINSPNSGTLDRTPNLQAYGANNYGETIEETRWSISGKGSTMSGVNTGMGASYLEYAPGPEWASYIPLDYGQTYTVNLSVVTSDGFVTGSTSKSFSIAAYEPVATLTAPIVKQNTLSPTISGGYSSIQGFGKEAHEFLIMTTGRSIIGRKTVLGDSSTSYSTTYLNDGTWNVYTPLQWGTSYIFAVRVFDSDGIWSVTRSGQSSERIIRTNTAPSPPTNLLPTTGSDVTTRQPQLYAQFNDIDTSDLPTLMEVQVAGVTNTTFGFSRVESDGDEIFSTLLSDAFIIGHTYSWRTRFTDNGGLQGAWSNWSTFTVREGVETAFVHPTMNDVLTTPIQTFAWSYLHPSGVPQASGRLRIYPQTGSVPIYDSGNILGAYLEQELITTLFENNKTYRARVTVTDNNGDSTESGFVYFQTSWVGPDQPDTLTVTPFHDDAMVRIEWQISMVSGFVAYRIYRRDPSIVNAPFVFVGEIRDRLAQHFDYYFAPSGKAYEYAVTIVENSTGAEIESNISDYLSTIIEFPYSTWLHEEYDPFNYQLQLRFNPDRSTTYQRETAMLHPIGRRFPVAHYGKSFNQTIQTSFMIRLPYPEIDMLEKMIERGLPILYRDGRGRKIWVALSGYTIQDMTANRGTLQLDLQRINTSEK